MSCGTNKERTEELIRPSAELWIYVPVYLSGSFPEKAAMTKHPPQCYLQQSPSHAF